MFQGITGWVFIRNIDLSLEFRMRVYVNNISLQVFEGATALDAIRLFYTMFSTGVAPECDAIYDKYGNTVEPDGRLSPESKLFTNKLINQSDPW